MREGMHSQLLPVIRKSMIVDFFKNIFFRNKEESTKNKLEEYSTYLTPWYFKGSVPKLGENLIWKQAKTLNGEKLSLTSLNSKKGCIGILDMYCYIKPLNNGNFLIWKRGSRKIELYNISDLNIIESTKTKWTELKLAYKFNAEPIDSIEYNFELYQTEVEFDFPSSFSEIDEIIQVNDLDGLYEDYDNTMMNTAIVILKPKSNKIEIYPQDWFNRAKEIDFGYQWITRADRIVGTEKIKIQGIRIDDYVLDSSCRQIVK